MVKKNNASNISNDAENTNNLQLNLNLDNLDDEKVKKEVFDLYEAINEGKIDLTPEEKKEILQELDLIINHLSNDEVKENLAIDDSSDTLNDVIDEGSASVQSVDVEDDVVSVDDALDDLIDDGSVDDSTPIDALVFDDSVDNSSSINSLVFKDSVDSIDVDDVVSVDDALDDLVGESPVESVVVEESVSIGESSVEESVSIGESSVEDSVLVDSVVSVDDALDDLIGESSVEDSASVGESSVEDSASVGESSVEDSVPVDNVVDDVVSVDDALDDLIGGGSVGSVVVDDSISIDESSVDDSTSVGEDSVLVDGAVSVVDALNDLVDDYSDEVAISVKNLSMEFKVSKDKIDTLKEFVIRTIKRNKSATTIVKALEDVSFDIPKGDRVGIIGFNGAGKSTLLKILSGVYDATEGTIETKGKIAPLLELGAGFDPNYTGKNNIFLNGAFLGYSEDFIKEKYDEILEFSELGDAINYHVKTYSSGMRAKLGFSIATMVEPDILILDEILSVGDIRFRRKSADKIRSLINSGITVLLVSHSVAQIRDLCNKAIWIDEGKLKMYGEVNKVCDAYTKAASKATRDQLENIQLD